jgi:heat shock protein HtpX
MYALHFNEQELRRHKLCNVVQSTLLVGGVTLLTATIGWLLFGPAGILWVIILIGTALAFTPSISPQVILGLYRARRLRRSELPESRSSR